jgi:hypothetical protein
MDKPISVVNNSQTNDVSDVLRIMNARGQKKK